MYSGLHDNQGEMWTGTERASKPGPRAVWPSSQMSDPMSIACVTGPPDGQADTCVVAYSATKER
jgi:hypothetical protein